MKILTDSTLKNSSWNGTINAVASAALGCCDLFQQSVCVYFIFYACIILKTKSIRGARLHRPPKKSFPWHCQIKMRNSVIKYTAMMNWAGWSTEWFRLFHHSNARGREIGWGEGVLTLISKAADQPQPAIKHHIWRNVLNPSHINHNHSWIVCVRL